MKLTYLTPEIKKSLLDDISSPDVFIDEDIIDYIDKINELPFINTTQCCQGHPDNGYLSVMIYKEDIDWFENDVIPNLLVYCEDISQKFEDIGTGINVRYLFWFKLGCTDIFFKEFIKLISQ